jgi:hypothetical protein
VISVKEGDEISVKASERTVKGNRNSGRMGPRHQRTETVLTDTVKGDIGRAEGRGQRKTLEEGDDSERTNDSEVEGQ